MSFGCQCIITLIGLAFATKPWQQACSETLIPLNSLPSLWPQSTLCTSFAACASDIPSQALKRKPQVQPWPLINDLDVDATSLQIVLSKLMARLLCQPPRCLPTLADHSLQPWCFVGPPPCSPSLGIHPTAAAKQHNQATRLGFNTLLVGVEPPLPRACAPRPQMSVILT